MWKNILIIILIVLTGYLYFINNQAGSTKSSFTDIGQPLGNDVVNCEFKAISDFYYNNKIEPTSNDNRIISYSTSNNEPQLITFTGISSKEPKVKGNLGDAPLTILKNDDLSIVLAEQNISKDIFIYTIFKKEKVASWYKSYNMINTPFALLSMGYCY